VELWLLPSKLEDSSSKPMNKKEPGAVAPFCNPSYSGGRDQEDRGSKPAWENSSREPIISKTKKTLHKKIGLVEWLKVKTLSSNPSTEKNKS
jgi:hypothetical protein